jgi:hypothetical protein
MKSKILTISLIVSAAILVSAVIQNNAIAYLQQKQGYSHHDRMTMEPGVHASGSMSSLQNDENGNPTWLVSGNWKGSISTTGSSPNATLHSKFNMVMTNGSALHDHEIYDFKLTNLTTLSDSITIYNGTATITMREGPVTSVPISIKSLESNVISIWTDPTMINNHFGDTPIFGTIDKLLEVLK